MKTLRLTLLVGVALGVLLVAGCTSPESEDDTATFVGAEACGTCHSEKYDNWINSGHPYKLSEVVNGQAPSNFPDFSAYAQDPTEPPAGTSWDDFAYTIGGFGWKMRWVRTDGYIYTPAEGGNQYNFQTESWGDYHAGDIDKPYNCGSCHTSGWVADEDAADDGDLTDNQDGLPGMHGTFRRGGVDCEECHGAGSLHADAPTAANAPIADDSSNLCGRCHSRGGVNGVSPGLDLIESKGGYIKHHEQYEEWYYSGHNSTYGPGCSNCHDSHSSVKWDDQASGEGTIATCESCHVEGAYADITETNHVASATCVDCHMPKASKSAVAIDAYEGDIKTHIWAINTDPVGKTEGMFTEDESAVIVTDGKAAVTLDFACYGCHTDAEGVGGTASSLSLEQLSEVAQNMHNTAPDPGYAGAETCENCHADHYDRWINSGHPYKLSPIVDGQAPTTFPSFSAFGENPTDPPAGTTWDDFAYAIGGYGWKMRWVRTDGYIYTPAEGGNQFNFQTASWGDYHAGDIDKAYDCGSCHTSGWVADEDAASDGDLTDNQDGLPGMHGTFRRGGVDCEECHGMGAQHAFAPGSYTMEVDDSNALCGRCHSRGGVDGVSPGLEVIEAKGGYIKHHEQAETWHYSGHNSTYGPGCSDCHDSHSSVKWDSVAPGEGTMTTCESCHVDGPYADITYNAHNSAAGCVDCHMSKAVKSAVAVNAYEGDIKNHLWAINTEAVGKDEGMFSEDGSAVLTEDGAAVTLDFACYGCHQDADGVGGENSIKTLEELSDFATGIHTEVP